MGFRPEVDGFLRMVPEDVDVVFPDRHFPFARDFVFGQGALECSMPAEFLFVVLHSVELELNGTSSVTVLAEKDVLFDDLVDHGVFVLGEAGFAGGTGEEVLLAVTAHSVAVNTHGDRRTNALETHGTVKQFEER